MHIKQLVIQGFKSYKDQTLTDLFSPQHNVIVGRNGSGKSNFFAAIRFVLSDAYTHMSREERQALLHEGSGTAVMSAYVEIVFDNSDNRFPTGHEEVVLRRTIGLKKDEYSLDRKSASKSDVMNLLESAGFSRSNPYYIVPQGRITSLTNAKDAERLSLLKEVAGTQVYEQRRAESLKVMNESIGKREKIDELLQYLEDRLSELDEEKDELKEYQEKDKEKRCFEYTLLDRELTEVNALVDGIEDDRQRSALSNDDRLGVFAERDQVIQDLESDINALQQKQKLLLVDRRQIEQERKDLIRQRATTELQLKNSSDNEHDVKLRVTDLQRDLQTVLADIAIKQAKLTEIGPLFEQSLQAEAENKKELAEADTIQQELYSKQGRNAQFNAKSERDKWIKKEVSNIQALLKQRQDVRLELEQQLQDMNDQLSEAKSEISKSRETLESSQGTLEEIQAQQAEYKKKRDLLIDERKELWRDGAKADSTFQTAKDELSKAERIFAHTMDRSQNAGLQAVNRIAKSLNLSGVYGPLCDLFEVDDKYKVAVEVTAGNSLFHVVVDNDTTASSIMEALNREKSGRVTFVPLNRLHSGQTKYPDAEDAIPLIDKIRYSPEHAKAIEQVFSKSIICWNLESSAQYARSHGLTAITLQGDQANKKGVLTGGYHDTRHSRIDATRSLRKWRDEYAALSDRAADIKKNVELKDQQITLVVSTLKKLETQKQELVETVAGLRDSLRTNIATETSLQEATRAKQRLIDNAIANSTSLENQIKSFNNELRSVFNKNLTQAETELLADVTRRTRTLRARDAELAASRGKLEQEKLLIELDLNQVLLMRRDQIRAEILESEITSEDADVDSLHVTLEQLQNSISIIESRIEQLEAESEDVETELATKESESGKLQNQQIEDARSIEKQQKGLERSMAKRGILIQRKDEINRKIRDLGALPEEAFDAHANLKSETILKRLHKLTDELKKFSHINKKAFEQYSSFTKQREALLNRRTELGNSEASIQELVQHLDQRKDEAIERTFKQVSKGFAEIFEKLVPAGKGRLIMQRRIDRELSQREQQQDDNSDADDDDNENENEVGDKSSVENYVGVAISVSFNSKNDEQQRIEQLSGGQKSLCALALIFAIQQCDPAPFYLFDEIDANLDAQYRTAVAGMIRELADHNNGQFICTTFRNEMIYTADKFYGVLFNNKISSVASITRDQALTFVEGEQPR
ncbi:RecF/RecN/SMC [Lipomyces japonicus]|uniref:RecF/RecN/SMC n=1 Tax=Lipomyces japonicus TaxID=56871 RepID=UPI0034CF08A6